MNLKALCTVVAAAAAFLSAGASNAQTMYGSLSSWEAAVGTWTETTNLGVPDGTTITGFTTADGVPVSVSGTVTTIGDAWATWCCGYTGQVVYDLSTQSVDYGLGKPVHAFGLFLEPEAFDFFDMTLMTNTGASLTQNVNGQGGAQFFGWVGDGVTGFTVSSTDAFAAGDFFSASVVSSVPEPATWAMLIFGLGMIGFAARRRTMGSTRAA